MKMRRTLYLKFLIIYFLFGIASVTVIATFTSTRTLKHLTDRAASSLYREATLIASNYAVQIYDKDERAKTDAEMQLKAIDTYISGEIWIINNSGRVLFNSRRKIDRERATVYAGFDPAAAGSYYMTGNFYGAFAEEALSVFSPITSDFKVIGYVVIHQSMKAILASKTRY